MEKYPVLDLIVRFGRVAAGCLAVLCGVLIGIGLYPALGWLTPLAGAAAAGLVFVAARSYVEMVTIVTEMLVPR